MNEILLISEDRVLEQMLAQLGHEVTVAASLDHVLRMAHSVHLILLDTGSKLLTGEKRQEFLRSNGTRTIVIVDLAQIEHLAGYLDAGAADFLVRPILLAPLKVRLKSLEERLRAAEARSDFMRLAAFDLKTPLASVTGYTEMLLAGMAGALTEQQKKALQFVADGAERLDRMIDQLRDRTQAEAGQLLVSPEATLIGNVITASVMAFRKQVEGKGQTLKLDIPDDLPAVLADQNRLLQALSAMVENAHQFTPPGGEVTICAFAQGDAPYVEFLVRDNGYGIPPAEYDRLYSAEKGLFIARYIIEAHGGRIWFESAVGKGTTFHFTIPAAVNAS